MTKVRKSHKAHQEARMKIKQLFQEHHKMEEMTRAMEAMEVNTRTKEKRQETAAEGLVMTADKWEEWVEQWEQAWEQNNKEI